MLAKCLTSALLQLVLLNINLQACEAKIPQALEKSPSKDLAQAACEGAEECDIGLNMLQHKTLNQKSPRGTTEPLDVKEGVNSDQQSTLLEQMEEDKCVGDCQYCTPHGEIDDGNVHNDMPLCANGEYQWACISGRRGGRVQCPAIAPVMCANKKCDQNMDYCCEVDCGNVGSEPFGGPLLCDLTSVPPVPPVFATTALNVKDPPVRTTTLTAATTSVSDLSGAIDTQQTRRNMLPLAAKAHEEQDSKSDATTTSPPRRGKAKLYEDQDSNANATTTSPPCKSKASEQVAAPVTVKIHVNISFPG